MAGRHDRAEQEDHERRGDQRGDDPDRGEAPRVVRFAGTPADGIDGLDDIHEAVHVAERLHRAAEAVEEAGGAGHEALPAVAALLAGAEAECRSCGARLLRRARIRTGSWLLRGRPAAARTRRAAGTTNVCEASSGLIELTVLPSTVIGPADGALDLREERVAQARCRRRTGRS